MDNLLFCKRVIDNGGRIKPLIIDEKDLLGPAVMNPSIINDNDSLFVNLRNVNYTLYHSEHNKFEHKYGPLSYIHEESLRELETFNFIGEVCPDTLELLYYSKVDTTELDVEPLWEFIGLEDARLVNWNNTIYQTGVRRDLEETGIGRMELCSISSYTSPKETSRTRIPAPPPDSSYCEKNWMPILDLPNHYVKWSNPTEIVKYDSITNTTLPVFLSTKTLEYKFDFRGSSQVVSFNDSYLCLVHECELFRTEYNNKDTYYRHRFIQWDKDWNIKSISEPFYFMGASVEFCCGLCIYKDKFLITFGFQDNCSFLLEVPITLVEEYLINANTLK